MNLRKPEAPRVRRLRMDNVPLRAGAFVSGGLFIGIWLFLGIFQTEMFDDLRIQVGLWWFWGFLGLLIAGGLFAGRVSSPQIRIAIWIALGIAVGMLIGAALFKQIGESTAALFTAGGGAIIIAGLPGIQPPEAPPAYAPEVPVEDEPRPRTRRSN